jgi:hypothetical protein
MGCNGSNRRTVLSSIHGEEVGVFYNGSAIAKSNLSFYFGNAFPDRENILNPGSQLWVNFHALLQRIFLKK